MSRSRAAAALALVVVVLCLGLGLVGGLVVGRAGPAVSPAGSPAATGPVGSPGAAGPAGGSTGRVARVADSTDDPTPTTDPSPTDSDRSDGSSSSGGLGSLPSQAPGPRATPARPTPRTPAPRTRPATNRPTAPRRALPAVDPNRCSPVPPPPIDRSEQARPGDPSYPPLPVPDRPVGGDRMGDCHTVSPAGAPAVPAVETSASWILADLDSGAVLAAHDPHARERPASCLKVLTALVMLRRLNLDTVVEGTDADADADGSRVGVGPGGSYPVRLLLTGLILNSGNDAANALARQLGGVPETLRAMTDTATELGATDTRPTSPSGLDAPGMSSSAYDLALVYRAVIRDPTFAEISRTRLADWPGRGDLPGFKISNDNQMLSTYPGTIGGKVGFTDDARHTRIAAAERHGRRLVAVLMRGETHPVPIDTQAARLLDWGFALPAGTTPVGTLVDGPADGAGPAPAGAGTATGPYAAEPPPSRESPLKALGVVGGGALLGALLSVWVARRGNRRSRTDEL